MRRLYLSLFLSTVALLLVMSVDADAQCMSSWAYRETIRITNGSATTSLSDHQVQITLNRASYIAAGQMDSLGRDIRITSNNGCTLLHCRVMISPATSRAQRPAATTPPLLSAARALRSIASTR